MTIALFLIFILLCIAAAIMGVMWYLNPNRMSKCKMCGDEYYVQSGCTRCHARRTHPSKRGVFIPTPLLYTFNIPVKRKLTCNEVDVIMYAYQLEKVKGYVDTNDMVLIDDGVIRMYILLDELAELVEQL